MEKEFLSQRGTPYVEKDVMKDAHAMQELIDLGVMTTPVTLIDGELVVGFDRKKLEQLLGA